MGSTGKRNVRVVKSESLSKPYEWKFVVVDVDTGEVLDNAQGYGYKTKQKAMAAWNYKTMDRSKDAAKKAKEKLIKDWMRHHKGFVDTMGQYCLEIECKGHVYLPKYTSSEKITYTNDFFNSNWYDKEFSESVYEQAYSSRSKQILAIHIYKQTKNSDVEAYLRRAGKSIAKRMIDEGNESGAVEFLQFGLMTTAALKTILKTAEAKGAASVSSYILMQLSNKKKSTFRL